MILTLFARNRDGRLSYYTLHDRQLSLDGLPGLTSAWRIEGGGERERRYSFADEEERNRILRRLFTRAVRRGYRLLYSFDRAGIGRFGIELEYSPDLSPRITPSRASLNA